MVNSVGHELCNGFWQALRQRGIDFHRCDMRARFQERQRKRTESWAHLKHAGMRSHAGLPYDPSHSSRVDNKILPEFLGRADVGFTCDSSHVCGSQ